MIYTTTNIHARDFLNQYLTIHFGSGMGQQEYDRIRKTMYKLNDVVGFNFSVYGKLSRLKLSGYMP